ncbi:MAG: hypothetical protein ACE15F_08480 [bacterium]
MNPIRFSLSGLLAPLALAVLLSGCDPKEVENTFPHKPHIDQGIGCDTCHEMKDNQVANPRLETCLTCHELGEDRYQKCKDCHDKAKIGWNEQSLITHDELMRPFLPKDWEDVLYKHGEHLKDYGHCLDCHKGVEKSTYASVENLPTMKTAMAVHDKLGLSNDCQVCHRELNTHTPPATHDSRWAETHGRMTEFTGTENCLMCHEEATCQLCHATQKPRNHTSLWRHKTHGLQASFDRAKCMVCHRDDTCLVCHQASSPPVPPTAYHTPDASCLSCHSPLAAQGPKPRPKPGLYKPMPHRMMMGVTSQKCLECHML